MIGSDDRQFPSSILPKDWDKPSEDNGNLCMLFARKNKQDLIEVIIKSTLAACK